MPRSDQQVLTFPHLLEILKIIDGAVNADPAKAAAYASQLAKKLSEEGFDQAAGAIRRVLAKAKTLELSPAKFGPGGVRMPVDGESRLSLGDEELVDPKESETVLTPSAQRKVDEFLEFVSGADKLTNHGVGVAPSLLLYGPPGCGKTQLARHIASRLKLPLVTARTDALISSFLGSTAKNLRTLFEHAMGRPCVLFLDEFDAVAKLRDDKQELGELKRVVVSLLQNIDALDNQTVCIAATNHEHLLDLAIWRRFSFRLRLDPPTKEARVLLFRRFLNGFASEGDFTLLAEASEGMTGAEIRLASDDAKRRAVLDDQNTLQLPDVLVRIASVRLRDHGEEQPIAERIRKTKLLAPAVFTNRRLAAMFKVSVGQVSNLLRKGESYA